MQSVLQPEPHHRMIHHKLKDSYTPIYLTALSVIQGVALADLGTIVWAGYKQFTIVQWLLVVLMFTAVISIWNEYTKQSTVLDWVPDLRDAAIPFVFGALELVLNHAIILSLSVWLIAMAALSLWGALATWHAYLRASKEEENARLLHLTPFRRGFYVGELYNVGLSIFLLLLALISHVEGFNVTDGIQTMRGALAVGLVLVATASLSGYGVIALRSWSRIVAYARTGQMPGMQAEDSAT